MQLQDDVIIEKTLGFSPLRAFRHRNFTLFFAGQSVSLIGTWAQMLAISWLVWRLTNSSVWLGGIDFIIKTPMVLLGLFAGVFTDRYDRLKSLTFLQMMCMVQALALGVLSLGHEVLLWHIVTLSIFLGVVYAFEFPIRQSYITDIVGKRDLLNAISLHAALFHASRTIGPSIAGLVVASYGEGICFLANAVSFVPIIVALLLQDRSKLIAYNKDHQPVFRSIKEGLSYMMKHHEIKLSIVIICVISFSMMPLFQLLPIFADEIFSGDSVLLGQLMAAAGMGSLIGAVVLACRKTEKDLLKVASGSLIFASISLVVFCSMSNRYLATAAMTAVGFFHTISISSSGTLIQIIAPDHMRGRIVSLFNIAFMGFSPFGSLFAGIVAKFIGAPITISILGGVSLVAGILIFAKRRPAHAS